MISIGLCVFLNCVLFVVAQNEHNFTEPITNGINAGTFEISDSTLKRVMWKKCSNNSFSTCAKLALIHIIEKLDTFDNYPLVSGVAISRRNDDSANLTEQVIVKHDLNDAMDKFLLQKIKKYLTSLTLNVKLLDKNNLEDMRSFGYTLSDPSNQERGRGKKKYMHSLMVAGWMSGATLLALTMKTIAILSGKALLAALLSLMLSVISAFSKGQHHGESKSTTYEIITKPIVAHSHSTDVHEAHASELSPAYAYKRSMSLEQLLRHGNVSGDIEHIIQKVKAEPYYSSEYSKSRSIS